MAQTRTSTNHAAGTNPAFTAAPGTVDGWWILPSIIQHARAISIGKSTDSTNVFELTTDITAGNTGKIGALAENTGSNVNVALTDTPFATGSWGYAAGVFASSNTNAAYSTGANKGTHTTTAVPSGVNATVIPGRITDFTSGFSTFAHVCAWARALSDLEVAYRQTGGNARWLSPDRYWKFAAPAGTPESPIVDQSGHENLTVTGLTAAGTDPVLATYWTGTAQGNVSYTQGTPISSITFSSFFDLMAQAVDYTVTLNQIGAAGTATSANGAGIASNALTVNAIGSIAAGQYVKIGAGNFVLVLLVSGSTLLLAIPQTWNNTDTVTPYPVGALALSGLSIAAGVFSGTPGAPAVGTYANCLWRGANNTTAILIADSALFQISVASSGAAPSFSAGPTLTSPTTDGYTFGATSNQTATWYAVAMLKGSTAPTAAQVKSGSPTGFVSRFSQALTAATPGTLTYTALTNPVYDLYHVVDNGSGTSAVSAFTNQLKSPPAGQQYVAATIQAITAITKANPASVTATAHGRTTGDWVEVYGVAGMTQINGTFVTCTVVNANTLTLDGTDSTAYSTYTSGGILSWGQSLGLLASTLPASGDVWQLAQVTTEDGLAITCQANGAIGIAGPVPRRQTFTANLYSVSAGALIGLATEYFQNIPPVPPSIPGNVLPALFLGANQTITNQVLNTLAQSPEGDALTATASGLPAGLSVVSSTLQGTTGNAQITPITITWTDAAGESTVGQVNLVIGNVTPPNLTGLTQGDIVNLLASYYLTPTFGSQDSTNAVGTAVSQVPSFGTPVVPNSTINVALSTGNAPGIPPVTPVVAPSLKSTTLLSEERLNALLSFQVFEAQATITMGSADLPATVYRMFRVPASARIQVLQIMNDANPSGSSIKIGVFMPNGGPVVVPGSDAILMPVGVTLDVARPYWTNLYTPMAVNTPGSVALVGKRLWELLGLPQDPSPPTQDQLYDVGITSVIPGTQGGNVALRLGYLRSPDRGMIAASATQY